MYWINSKHPGMGYQNFSVNPLVARTEATQHRIDQLRNDLRFVKQKSVLDIGCHAGLASIIALESGARQVIATDVNDEYLSKIQEYAESCGLGLTTECVDFLELKEKHASDVVLFLEVYHWLVKQSVTVDRVIKTLDEIAQEFILIESPVDRSDPSVIRATSGRTEGYQIYNVLDGLIEKGWTVEFWGLTRYFPSEYLRGRFWLRRTKTLSF